MICKKGIQRRYENRSGRGSWQPGQNAHHRRPCGPEMAAEPYRAGRIFPCAIIFLLLLTVLFSEDEEVCAYCHDQNSSSRTGLVAVLMPSEEEEKWRDSGNYIAQQLGMAGLRAELLYAGNDLQRQCSQIEDMTEKGAAMIILASVESSDNAPDNSVYSSGSLARAVAKAEKKGVCVILYDSELENGEAGWQLSFSCRRMGEEQARFLTDILDLDHSSGVCYSIAYLPGPGPGSRQAAEAAAEFLEPYQAKGLLALTGDYDPLYSEDSYFSEEQETEAEWKWTAGDYAGEGEEWAQEENGEWTQEENEEWVQEKNGMWMQEEENEEWTQEEIEERIQEEDKEGMEEGKDPEKTEKNMNAEKTAEAETADIVICTDRVSSLELLSSKERGGPDGGRMLTLAMGTDEEILTAISEGRFAMSLYCPYMDEAAAVVDLALSLLAGETIDQDWIDHAAFSFECSLSESYLPEKGSGMQSLWITPQILTKENMQDLLYEEIPGPSEENIR